MTVGGSHPINSYNKAQSAEKWHNSEGAQLARHVVCLTPIAKNSHKRITVTRQVITKDWNTDTTMAGHKW